MAKWSWSRSFFLPLKFSTILYRPRYLVTFTLGSFCLGHTLAESAKNWNKYDCGWECGERVTTNWRKNFLSVWKFQRKINRTLQRPNICSILLFLCSWSRKRSTEHSRTMLSTFEIIKAEVNVTFCLLFQRKSQQFIANPPKYRKKFTKRWNDSETEVTLCFTTLVPMEHYWTNQRSTAVFSRNHEATKITDQTIKRKCN